MKKKPESAPIVNRRARFDYELGETISAGIILSGAEVRGARMGHVRLTGSYANIKQNELWLTNMSISIPDTARNKDDDKENSNPRKLLVTKKELFKIEEAKKQGMTIVPTRLFTTGRFIKIELSLAKGKKNYDKRETIKRRQQDRDAKREIKR
ncbi:SsrA-binding protein SmpB [Candidatus Nomurabacteria bacterium]|jgi:SsrA-binding protein|nr:SsrA-binding protein SmpB [Candidatus Saccharibacteria bacterium]MCA9312712.1 SsrA-binding protein SmpB [Candidatus Saccharibacteria bacterium]MCB9822462.1 SsrA-binding protein SmpB [Candidatus Nomurabacteria bacterium]